MKLNSTEMKKHAVDELFANKIKDHTMASSQRAATLFQQRMAERQMDELFANKLHAHQVEPSSRANLLFQERLTEKKKPKGIFYFGQQKNYYWAAAASILLMIGIGWWTIQPNSTTNIAKIENEKPVLKIEAQAQPTIIENVASTQLENTSEKVVTEKSPERVFTNNSVKFTPTSPTKEEPFKIPTVKPIILDEPIMDKLSIAVLDAQRERSKEEIKKRREVTADGPQFKNSVAETIIVITDIKPAEEQLIIPELGTDSPVTLAQATEIGRTRMNNDRSFIAKVFTEIQHLKHGEKLDVAALSLKSDDRSDEGFIAVEKQELTYRIEKIKSIFAKNTTN